MRGLRLGIPLVLALVAALAHPAAAEPVKIRVGWIVAPASLVPLLFLKPELANNYNKSYSFDPVHFASSNLQITAISQGEIDIAYLLTGPVAEEIQRTPGFRLVAPKESQGTFWLDLPDQWDPKSPWADRRVRLAASHAIDRNALNQAETLGFSKPTGGIIPRAFEFARAFEPPAYDPASAKKLLAEAGYPNGFDAGDLYPWPPYTSMGEALASYLQAAGIRTRIRTMDSKKVLYQRQPDPPNQVIDGRAVAMMNTMLQQVVISGSAKKAEMPGWQPAGKTGTSQDFRDAWFLGYTSYLVTGVWLGNDDNTPTKKTTGGGLPVEIWSRSGNTKRTPPPPPVMSSTRR